MQQSFDGIPRPLSSRPAQVTVTVCLDPDGLVHHVEYEVRGIQGNLLAAEAAPGSLFTVPGDVGWWTKRHVELGIADAG